MRKNVCDTYENNLAENEIHIANYYMRRGAFIAAVK